MILKSNLEADAQTGLPVVPLWIDGAPTSSSPSKRFPVHSSQQNKDVYLAESADVKAANLAADAAGKAFQTWRKTSFTHRRDLLFRVAANYIRRTEELVQLQMEETSCTSKWARMNVSLATDSVREVACRISAVSGEIPQMANPEHLALVFREPLGPILTIAPWNAALILASRAITSPIALGCTIVFKASELCPRTHYCLLECWTEAGLQPGVLNVVQTQRSDAPATTETLIAHPSIRKVEFIGSKAVGNIIAQMCAKHTKPIFLELGGKSAALVLNDAKLEQAADLCLMGAFLHHGQICFSTERILVQSSVASEFKKLLQQKSSEHHSAGHAINVSIASNANAALLDAQSKGAEFLFGGPGFQSNASALKPTIVTSVTEDMTIFDAETFGPSASLYTFDSDSEAVELANRSIYGLNAAVHTTNLSRGIDIARQLQVGQVHINNLTEYDESTIPVGGERASGWGRSNAAWGFTEYLSLKTITANMKEPHTYI